MAAKSDRSRVTKVRVVDDHPVFPAELVGLLEQEQDVAVYGEADDATQNLMAVDRLQSDLMLLDMSPPD